MPNSKTIILAVDGGGIRGIIPAYILSQLEQATGKPCYQLFDVIGGTSTGGIISIGLTTPNPAATSGSEPFSAAELLAIYENDGAQIFVAQDCDVDYCATYYGDDGNGNGVEPFLQNTVGTATSLSATCQTITGLTDARVKQVFTTGYIVNSTGGAVSNPVQGQDFGPYLFNWADAVASADDDYYVWEAARATSAAPVYFPIANVGGSGPGNYRSAAAAKWIVDGGTMSNNPAMWGITEALRLNLTSDISDIIVISIGTGVYPGGNGVGISNNAGDLVPTGGNWSETPWMILDDMYDLEGNEAGATLLTVILNAVQLVTGAQLTAMVKAGLTYYRLEPPVVDSMLAMDDVSPANIANLLAVAQNYIAPAGDGEPAGPGYATFEEVVNLLT